MSRRVVVTGVGLVCGCGIGTDEVWRNLLAGKSGIARITQFDASAFDCQIAGEVKGFEPLNWIEKKEVKKMARFIQMAMAASDFAVRMAKLDITPDFADADRRLHRIGHRRIRRHRARAFEISERRPGQNLSVFHSFRNRQSRRGQRIHPLRREGAEFRHSNGLFRRSSRGGRCYKIIQRCDAEVMIAGGSEAAVTPMSIGGFSAMRALSTRNDEPKRASRPFDADRDGFVVGEGSGILILESLEFAQRRGANIIAEIVGYGMSGDAYHITQPAEGGDGGYRVSLAAIKDAKITPDEVSYVNAHGTSTPMGDAIETSALSRVFGERAKKVPISSTKSMTGHLLGGAGGLEAGISVLALRDQILPPTINQETPDPACDLDYVPNHARKAEVVYALSNSFGFGGTNASLIFKRWDGR